MTVPSTRRQRFIVGQAVAPFRRRVVAALIDAAILLPPMLAVGALIAVMIPTEPLFDVSDMLVSAWPVPVIYFTLANRRGASWGKRRMGLAVVTKRGVAPKTGRAAARAFLLQLSLLFWGLGYVWAAWDPSQQAWHDKLTGTYVVEADAVYP